MIPALELIDIGHNFAVGVLTFPKMFLFVLFLRGESSQDSFFHSLRNNYQEGRAHRANKLDAFFYFFLFFFFNT